jgi:hypothetical protein
VQLNSLSLNYRSKIIVKKNISEEEDEPMSLKGAIFFHPYKDIYILVIISLGKQVHLTLMKTTLQSTLMKHKCFSSIVVSIFIFVGLYLVFAFFLKNEV